MKKEKLEFRMYGFTLYNISPIQQGIQFGHAVVEYGLKHSKDKDYQEWARDWKTFIILNGGTSNAGHDHYEQGSMEDVHDVLVGQGIKFAKFREPDLNLCLSGICLLVDERVFDREKYSDFIDYLKYEKGWGSADYVKRKMDQRADLINDFPAGYKKWLKSIGGEKNEFLRDYLKQFKLA